MNRIRVLAFTSTSISLLAITLLAMGKGTTQSAPVSQSAANRTPAIGKRVNTSSRPKAAPQSSSQVSIDSSLPENPKQLEQIRSQLNAQRQRFAVRQGSSQIDKAVGRTSAGAVPSAATLNRTFEGFSATGWNPPDPIMAAGPSALIVSVNSSWRIYNKTGGQLFDSTLSSWFSNVLPSDQSGIRVFDPWVIYDRDGGRFILLALAKRDSDKFSRFLISVSDNNTATGNWCNWSLDAKVNGSTNTDNWADYTKVGNNNNAIILSANMFAFGGGFQYSKLRFLPKAALYNTNCPGVGWWDEWNLKNADNSTAFTIQPAHSYNSSNTDYLVNTTSSGSGDKLTLWKATNNSNSDPRPTLTRSATLNVGSYAVPPLAEQPGTSTRLNTGDARLLNAVWRGGGLWTTHSTACSFSGDPTTRSCLRYYQINPDTGTVLQNLTWGASGSYYYYPAITADPSNNAWLVFNRSSSTEYASIRHTARRGTDPANSLQGSAQLRAGQGCYIHLDSIGRNRWGDYNGMAWDPSTGGAWIFSEFAYGTSSNCGSNVWRTQIGELAKP